MTAFTDACLQCHPGDAPAAKPLTLELTDDGMLAADYRCTACGTTWRTKWTVTAWPAVRDYRQAGELLTKTIALLAELLDGEELEGAASSPATATPTATARPQPAAKNATPG